MAEKRRMLLGDDPEAMAQNPRRGPRIRPDTGYTPPTRAPSRQVSPYAERGPRQPLGLPTQGVGPQVDAYTGADRNLPPPSLVDPRTQAMQQFAGQAPPGGDPALNALQNLPAPGFLSDEFYNRSAGPGTVDATTAATPPGPGQGQVGGQGQIGGGGTYGPPKAQPNYLNEMVGRGLAPMNDYMASQPPAQLGYTSQAAGDEINVNAPQPTNTRGINYAGRYGQTDVFAAPGEFEGTPVTRFSDYANRATLSGGKPAPLPGPGEAGYGNPVIGGVGGSAGGVWATPGFAERGAQTSQALQGHGLLPAQSVTGQDMTLANRYLRAADQYRQARLAGRPQASPGGGAPLPPKDGGGFGLLSQAHEALRRAYIDSKDMPAKRRTAAYEAALEGHRQAFGLPSPEETIARGNQAVLTRGQDLQREISQINAQATQAEKAQGADMDKKRYSLDYQKAKEDAYQGRVELSQKELELKQDQMEPPAFADLYNSISGNPYVDAQGNLLPLAEAFEQHKRIFGNQPQVVMVGPDGQPITMDDVMITAQKRNLTPEQVIQALQQAAPNGR